jgi:hypothetical protein
MNPLPSLIFFLDECATLYTSSRLYLDCCVMYLSAGNRKHRLFLYYYPTCLVFLCVSIFSFEIHVGYSENNFCLFEATNVGAVESSRLRGSVTWLTAL